MIAANSEEIATSGGASSAKPPVLRNSTHAISATAPPPTPLNSATICGIAVIFTCAPPGRRRPCRSRRRATIRPQLPDAAA